MTRSRLSTIVRLRQMSAFLPPLLILLSARESGSDVDPLARPCVPQASTESDYPSPSHPFPTLLNIQSNRAVWTWRLWGAREVPVRGWSMVPLCQYRGMLGILLKGVHAEPAEKK